MTYGHLIISLLRNSFISKLPASFEEACLVLLASSGKHALFAWLSPPVHVAVSGREADEFP